MAAYKLSPKVTLQFNIYNLTDKLYYESAYTNWAVPAREPHLRPHAARAHVAHAATRSGVRSCLDDASDWWARSPLGTWARLEPVGVNPFRTPLEGSTELDR